MTLKDKVEYYERALERISLRNVDAIEEEAKEASSNDKEFQVYFVLGYLKGSYKTVVSEAIHALKNGRSK